MKTVLPPKLVNNSICRGSVLRSLAGHDKNEIFIALQASEGWTWLADGASRQYGAPKRKRVLHVRSLGCLDDPSALDRIDALGDEGQRNAALRKLLKEYVAAHLIKEET
jgi:hypothetical protein